VAPADSGANNVYDVIVQVADGNGDADTQAIAITVTNVNEAPVITSNGGAATATVNAAENQSAVTTVTSTDVDGGASIYTIIGGADQALFSVNAATGVLTFNIAPNFEIPADAGGNNVYDVTVLVADGNGGFDTQAIAVTVTNVNEAPVISSNGGAATATVNAAENQTAVTTVTSADVDGGAPIYSIIGGADAALFSINATGVLTFNTAPNFEAPADAGADNVYDVIVQVADSLGGFDTQGIAVTVTNVNEAPVASPVTLTPIAEDSGARTISAQLLTGVTDVDNTAAQLTITALSISSGNGTLVNNSGIWTYTPALNDDSAVSFNYTVSDGALSASATASLDISPVSDVPVIGGDTTGTVTEDTAPVLVTAGALTISDGDARQSAFVASGATGSYGTFSIDTAGKWTYSADGNQAAIQKLAAGVTLTDTFTVLSADRTAQNVVITLVGANDVPVAADQNVTITDSTAYILRTSDFHFTDSDGDKLAKVKVTALPGDGTLMLGGNAVALNQQVLAADIAAGNLRFVPRTGIPVQETIAIGFQVSDGAAYSTSHTLSVLITPTNTPVPAPGPQVLQSNVPAERPAVSASTPVDAAAKNTRVAADSEIGVDRLKKQVLDVDEVRRLFTNDASSSPTATPRASGFVDVVRNVAGGQGIQLIAPVFTVEGITTSINLVQLKAAEAAVEARTAIATASSTFIGELDLLRKSVQADEALERNIMVSSVATGAGMSVGYVLWLLRGGLLLSSLLSSLPAWRFVDPLPVLGRLGNDEDDEAEEDDDSLESLVRAGDRAEPANASKSLG
jgi:VCBS repeat-containing protein